MRNFETYIKNDKYAVGCTGQTVYVYDSTGNEIAKFKDLIYAYNAIFSPDGKLLIVKSVDGRLAVYDLQNLRLIKKFRFSKVDCAQDDYFCFSKKGDLFYNIERQKESYNSCIAIYDTKNFCCQERFYADDPLTEPNHIEYDDEKDAFFVLGFIRDEETLIFDYGFVAKFENGVLKDPYRLTENEYNYYRDYKHLEMTGYQTWQLTNYLCLDPDTFENEKRPLSFIWEYYANKNQ